MSRFPTRRTFLRAGAVAGTLLPASVLAQRAFVGGLPTELLDPATPVDDALLLLRAQLEGRGIEVLWDRPEGLPRVFADRQRLGQLVLNLLVNARDALAALPPQAPRSIRLGVEAAGGKISISVTDTVPCMIFWKQVCSASIRCCDVPMMTL